MREDLCRKLGIITVEKYDKKVKEYESRIKLLQSAMSEAESKAASESEFSEKLQKAFDLAMSVMAPHTLKKYSSIGYWIAQVEIKEKEEDQKILKNEPNFSSLSRLSDRDVQTVLRYGDISNHELAVALSNATAMIQDTIFRNLSKRLAAMIKEDMDFAGPFQPSEVNEAQIKISKVLRKFIDENKVMW